jgi:serine phosphatase RsbU (regulator of sigma subunit)
MKTTSLSSSVTDVICEQDLRSKVEVLERKTIELEESIRYAGSLQQSILPNDKLFQNAFNDAFVLFKPKDIVSGDFYWFAMYDDSIYVAVGDCTGHGIPGALVNIAGNTILRQIIRTEGVSDPALIVSMLDTELSALFNDNRTSGQTRDGMDLIFCKFNLDQGLGYCCTAGRPLVMVRDGEIHEIKKGSYSIGHDSDLVKYFETTEFNLCEGDRFYMFTDGYTDQFGGDNVKKFNRKRFRNLLVALDEYKLSEQRSQLDLSFENWKGGHEQIDDVCVLGIEI